MFIHWVLSIEFEGVELTQISDTIEMERWEVAPQLSLSHNNNKAFSSTCTKWHKTQTKGKKNQKQSHEICPTGLIFHLDSCQLVLFFHSFSSASSSAVFFCLQMKPIMGTHEI